MIADRSSTSRRSVAEEFSNIVKTGRQPVADSRQSVVNRSATGPRQCLSPLLIAGGCRWLLRNLVASGRELVADLCVTEALVTVEDFLESWMLMLLELLPSRDM